MASKGSLDLDCNFFDTEWASGSGKSEQILSKLLKKHAGKKLYVATKTPAKNFKWPAKPSYKPEDCYPAEHVIDYTERSLKNLDVDCIDLQQFHVWDDSWSAYDGWKKGVEKLKKEGKVKHFGVSVNRWEPNNVLDTLKTGLIDSVQVIYNIFDQNPEDHLFPLCRKLDIAVIARVPFDEGTLTGTLSKATVFPKDDWRSTYFVPENLNSSVDHADALRPLIPSGMTMPEMALRFILCNDDVHTIIPGMRKVRNVEANMATGDGKKLSDTLRRELIRHRWDRTVTEWSQ